MQHRPMHDYDPPVVVGLRQRYISGSRRIFGVGCSRWLMGCGVLLLTLMVLCVGSLFFYSVSPPPRINVLVIGVDARREVDDPIARTDSIMIMSINPANDEVALLSIPRDVHIGSRNFGRLPINTIVRNAELQQQGSGIDELQDALEQTFNIQINHIMRFNFEGFVEIVDAVGGVEIDVPKRIVDNAYPTSDGGTMRISFEPGLQTMDGETALIYARTRHSDDDYQRAGRQQQVLQAVLEKLTTASGVFRLPLVVSAVLDYTETTMNLAIIGQYAPALALYGRNPSMVESLVLTRDYLNFDESGRASPNISQVDPWVAKHLR